MACSPFWQWPVTITITSTAQAVSIHPVYLRDAACLGQNHLRDLGLQSWEQAEWLYKQKLEQDDRDWDAKVVRESNQEVGTQRHAPAS